MRTRTGLTMHPKLFFLLLGVSLLCALLHAQTSSSSSADDAFSTPQPSYTMAGDNSIWPQTSSTSSKDGSSTSSKSKTKEKDEETTVAKDPYDRYPPHLFEPLTWGSYDEWKLQLGGEERIRNEHRYDFDMNEHVPPGNDRLWLYRTRVNADLMYCSFLRGYLDVVDARTGNAMPDYHAEAYWHVHQAFLELRDIETTAYSAYLRAGRQEMYYGEHRLVDSSRWSNLIQTYEGVRARYTDACVDVNAFLVQPDYYQRIRGNEVVTGPQRRLERVWFYGLYSTFFNLKPTDYDFYFLGQNDLNDHRTFPTEVVSEEGNYGTTDRYTVGTRWRGPIWKEKECGTLAYDFETAYQFGQRAGDEIEAYMVHGDINYQWDHPWKPKLTFLGNLASGDRHFGDGEYNTFNPLYGSTHGPYGIIDFVRLQNLRELAVTATVEPCKKWYFDVEAHDFWLDSKTDAWYSTSGSVVERDTSGHSGREIGKELDFIARYEVNKFNELEAGAAYFKPGEFARNTGHPDSAHWFYVQWTYNF